ncbi:MAG: hypothetical protein ACIALR_01205, partial [Blastopirellula sp. JB062]
MIQLGCIRDVRRLNPANALIKLYVLSSCFLPTKLARMLLQTPSVVRIVVELSHPVDKPLEQMV